MPEQTKVSLPLKALAELVPHVLVPSRRHQQVEMGLVHITVVEVDLQHPVLRVGKRPLPAATLHDGHALFPVPVPHKLDDLRPLAALRTERVQLSFHSFSPSQNRRKTLQFRHKHNYIVLFYEMQGEQTIPMHKLI